MGLEQAVFIGKAAFGFGELKVAREKPFILHACAALPTHEQDWVCQACVQRWVDLQHS